MGIFDRNFRDMLASQVVSVAGGLAVGTVLALYMEKTLLLPGMLIILPGLLEMRGSISGSLSSRIASGLFLGVFKNKKASARIVKGNIMASFLLAVVVSIALGLLAFLFNYLVLQAFTPSIIILPVLAGIIANAIEIPLALAATFYLFRKGHDPNNIMGPFITSTGDVVSVASILIAMVII